jgi:hypothetical protein
MTPAIKATTLRSMPQLIKTVQALHAKAIKYTDKADQIWITIGIELKEAKDRNREHGELTWPEFAKKHFDFGQSRADELIRIADGRTTVEEVRAGTAERVQKHAKAKPALANAGSSKTVLDDDDEPEEDTHAAMVDGYIATSQMSDQQKADFRISALAVLLFTSKANAIASSSHDYLKDLTVNDKVLQAATGAAEAWADVVTMLKASYGRKLTAADLVPGITSH